MISIQFTGLKTEVTDALRQFTTEKFTKLHKLAPNLTNVHVTFSVDKLRHKAEATLHVPKLPVVHAQAESEDMYKTVDLLVDKVTRQLARHKEKTTDHG